MLTCKEITALATDHAEGRLAEPARAELVSHLAGCRSCAEWVGQLETTAQALRALPEPELPAALQASLMAGFDRWAATRAHAAAPAAVARPATAGRGRLVAIPALGVAAVFGLLLGMARHPAGSPADWAFAFGLAAVAVALVLVWRRLTLGLAAVAASAAALAAVVTGGHGELDGAGGLECLLTVGVAAGGATAAAWAALRREPAELLRPAMGAWAVAGALAAVGALQVACGAHSSLAHLLAFHVGGLLVVVAAGALAARPRPAPARS